MSASVRRLYTELKPVHYDLHIVPDAASLKFTGVVTIRLKKTGRPSQRLTFHQHGLTVSRASIVKQDKKGRRTVEVVRINNQNTLHEVRLHTQEMVYSGDYVVTLEFGGTITRSMSGLYPCFFEVNGAEHVLLATQFESHHAREVFPCVDEPEAKATFQLTLISPENQQVLSNTPVEDQHAAGKGLVETTFEATPRMSTYLLAFVIGELHGKHTNTERGTEVSVWATIAQPLDSLDFGLDTAKRTIEFFEDYFGIEYPLAKADHVALPDFSAGAMENWGLITYRERLLLAYPSESSQSTLETIALVIAHETSHQWFGNLVTMHWWNDLWLNESFASVMEYQAIDRLFPEWRVWDTFVMSEGLSSLRRDATKGVQAVKTEVRHPDEISTLFDPSIVYAKGARLLYMLKTFMGDEAFRKGLAAYFTRHAYGSTTGDDLWQALQGSSGVDVAGFMNPWLERSGFPMVTVDQDGRRVSLDQRHFLESGELSDGRIWPIPLFSNHAELPGRLDKVALRTKLGSDVPLLVNQGAAGHYIVTYTQPGHRAYLVDLVRHKKLGVAERLMLLNSASMASKAGHQPFGDVLRLLEAYEDEQNEAVWGTLALVIAEARRFIDLDETLEAQIKELVLRLIAHEYRRLGWDEQPNESAADRKLRATIIGLGAYADSPEIVNEATKRFKAYKENPDGLNPELRSIVFGVPVKHKLAGSFAYLLDLHDKSVNSDLKSDVAAALTITRDKKEAVTLLGRLKDASLVKPQDMTYWLVYMLRNRYVREEAWDWMVDNWTWIEDTFSEDKSYDQFPRYAAAVCNTKQWAEKYTTFFKPKESEIALKRNIVIGLAEIETRVRWLERDLAAVRAFFERS